jgi:ABC-type polysaccharide/polyol phosphate export permease
MSQSIRLWWTFVGRELKTRYLGSVSGMAWAFLHPALLLALYAFLLTVIFKVRAEHIPPEQIVAHVAIGLWPWLTFSEAWQRATLSLIDNAPLLGKVSLPTTVLVLSSVGATFALHGMGFVFVLALLEVFGINLALSMLWLLLPTWLMLFLLAAGLSLASASIQVFIRDLAQILSQLLAFAFFLTPVLYSKQQLPSYLQNWFDLNPLSMPIEALRAGLLNIGTLPDVRAWLVALAVAVAVLLLGLALHRRLKRHLEDFL